MLAALSLLASLLLLATLRSTEAAVGLPPALSESSAAAAAADPQAANTHADSRSLADQAYDDTPVLPAVPWWPARVAPAWPQPTPRHGHGTRPQPRLRPPSA